MLVDLAAYQIFMAVGIDRNIAKGISFICGSIVGFIINKLWTFESRIFSKSEIIRYSILYSCTAIINSFVNKTTLTIVPIQAFGFLCATGVSTVLNFWGQKYFVFRK